MNHAQKLQFVHDAIVERVPEILELKAGCAVIYSIDDDPKERGKRFGAEVLPIKSGNEDYVWVRGEGEPKCFTISRSYILKILGHEIRLADVLEAAGSRYAVSGSGMILHFTIARGWRALHAGWKLNVPLHLQSEPTLNFLYDIFSK